MNIETLTLDAESSAVLQRYLTNGESLRWADKPQVRWRQEFRRKLPVVALFVILFVFMLANIIAHRGDPSTPASAPQTIATAGPNSQSHEKAPLVVAVIVSFLFAAFFSCWCYIMFRGLGGQKLINFLSLSKTYYGLTDDRLILVSGKKEFRVVSYHLRTITDLRMLEEADGIGTVAFGPKDRWSSPFQVDEIPALVLKNIRQANRVYSLIFTTQAKLLGSHRDERPA